MGFFGFGATSLSPCTDAKTFVAQYQRLRPIRRRLNDQLVAGLSGDAINEGARRLGILRNGIIVFDDEFVATVLMDYCIYDVDHAGRNAIEQYLCDSPPDADSDEMSCLRAMQHATYALVAVLSVEPGVGCRVLNMFTDETRLLVDISLSRTAKPGMLLATRLLDYDGFVTTSGAVLPLGILNSDELDEWQRKLHKGVHDVRSDPAPFIRGCLEKGASSNIRYEEMEPQGRSSLDVDSPPVGISTRRRRAPTTREARNTGPNRRCRCQSGKMYKNCCGKR